MDVINGSMRKGIKVMAVTCQTARFITILPKPKDFVAKIVDDVVYLSAMMQKMVDDINIMLDNYTDIPLNFIMTQVNGVSSSLTGIVNRVNDYTSNATNVVMGMGENTMATITELTGAVLDSVNVTSQAIANLGMSVSKSTTSILGMPETSEKIGDAATAVLEWTDNGFKKVGDDVFNTLSKATDSIAKARNEAMASVNNTMSSANETINNSAKWVEELLIGLKEKMNRLASKLDGGFKDVTGLDSVTNGVDALRGTLAENGDGNPAAQVVGTLANTVSEVLKNFNIGKVVTAFTGVMAESLIVKAGLDQLPPINFEAMLDKVRSDVELSNEELRANIEGYVNENYVHTGDVELDQKNYKEFMKQYNEELRRQRAVIRAEMKEASHQKRVERKENGTSAIKEIRKLREKAKKGRQTEKLSSIIKEELIKFRKSAENKCNELKYEWESAKKQYKDAIEEIKEFFQKDGAGSKFIDDCCDRINKDCDDIKELCSSIGTQLIMGGIKVVMPADIGTVFPNPIYKISSFFMDFKTIFKFIKDLISLVIDIVDNVNKLARIMINGLNSLTEIISQLMDMIGLKWLMDLIQSIIDLFGSKLTDSAEIMENSLSPIYFGDTDEYQRCEEIIESISDSTSNITEGEFDELCGILNKYVNYYELNIMSIDKVTDVIRGDDDYEDEANKFAEDFESFADEIVAYKSPIIERTGSSASVSQMVDRSKKNDTDMKIIGWHFYHPNLKHVSFPHNIIGKFKQKIKSRIIKKAARTGNKKNGGVYGLKNRWKIRNGMTAMEGFYWYTYYTDDMLDDGFNAFIEDGSVMIRNSISVYNGSIVEISDNGVSRKVFVRDENVKSGDYVSVNGMKYRVL